MDSRASKRLRALGSTGGRQERTWRAIGLPEGAVEEACRSQAVGRPSSLNAGKGAEGLGVNPGGG